ncbi:hypothetical protein MXB_3598 [Myxobolus squamalis]|nr:hypothetical protein MXB_3598 [Myxobolus squamalis]
MEIQANISNEEFKEMASDCIKKAYLLENADFKPALDLPNLMKESKAIYDPKRADEFRNIGNAFMKEAKYNEALEEYSSAIKHDPSNYLHFGNRAAAKIKLEQFSHALDDALISVSLNPNFHKDRISLMALGDYANAKPSIERVISFDFIVKALELDPNNQIYKEKLEKCKIKIEATPDHGADPFGAGMGQIFNNPAFMNMAQSVMQNPQFQQVFSGIAQNLQGEGGSIDFSSIANAFQNLQASDPDVLNRLRENMGQDPQGQ